MAIKIKKASDSDELRQIAVLAKKIWHECFKNIISDAQIDYMVDKFQSFKAMTEQTENQGYSYFQVFDNDELCGYFAIKPENDSRFFLSKLYLRKDKRGQGIARTMMNRVFEEAKIAGKKSVYLTVNKHNNHATDVYKKIGFRITGTPVTDIGDGFVMDDYVMEYLL